MVSSNIGSALRGFKEEFEIIKGEYENSRFIKVIDGLNAAAKNRPIILYGAGDFGKTALAACRERGIAVTAFCDRSKQGAIDGIEIISPTELIEHYKDAVVMVALQPSKQGEITKTLLKYGFRQSRIVWRPRVWPYCLSMSEFERHLPGYEWAYGYFEDEASKRLVLDKIRLILCDQPLQSNVGGDMYLYAELMTFENSEVIVDGGAWIGDTAQLFLEEIESCLGHIYSFEPDERNLAECLSKFADDSRVTVVPKGLWSAETELTFTMNANPGGSSFIKGSSANKAVVPVTSLDEYFKDKPEAEWPTFIKMDIEGSEREALLGSAKVIKAKKPKLAICAYHKPEDIYELPQAILSIRNDYKLALRQQEYGNTDTLLYGV